MPNSGLLGGIEQNVGAGLAVHDRFADVGMSQEIQNPGNSEPSRPAGDDLAEDFVIFRADGDRQSDVLTIKAELDTAE